MQTGGVPTQEAVVFPGLRVQVYGEVPATSKHWHRADATTVQMPPTDASVHPFLPRLGSAAHLIAIFFCKERGGGGLKRELDQASKASSQARWDKR